VKEQRRSVDPWLVAALAVYGLTAAAILLAPFSVTGLLEEFSRWVRDDLHLTAFGSGWLEFLANILMFVPLGLLLTLLFAHPWRGVVLALLLSAGAELAQFVLPSRHPSLRDVLANVAGAAIGAAIAWLLVLRRRRGAASDEMTVVEAPPS